MSLQLSRRAPRFPNRKSHNLNLHPRWDSRTRRRISHETGIRVASPDRTHAALLTVGGGDPWLIDSLNTFGRPRQCHQSTVTFVLGVVSLPRPLVLLQNELWRVTSDEQQVKEE